MEVQPDFRELLALFNANNVACLVVGAHALAYHGVPRYTGDLDILVQPNPENAIRIVRALGQFGFGSLGLTQEDFAEPDKVVQLGCAPVRIDILTSLTGVTWEECMAGCCADNYGEVPVNYLGKRELILNKRALGRAKDLADIEALEGIV
ncbi:MAG TPA: hypothetical protein PLI09_14550 [Candidatus Hydrogenedentes bacterium]|nr:hypothetical protein [Candidatus Hydrogenedentota bacterium]